MRFVITGSFLFVAFAVFATAEEWSWGKASANKDQEKPAESDGAVNRESKSIDSYSEVNDDSSNEDSEEGGASLANASGNETDIQARHLIRDRLCGLGLMEVNNLYFLYDFSLSRGESKSFLFVGGGLFDRLILQKNTLTDFWKFRLG